MSKIQGKLAVGDGNIWRTFGSGVFHDNALALVAGGMAAIRGWEGSMRLLMLELVIATLTSQGSQPLIIEVRTDLLTTPEIESGTHLINTHMYSVFYRILYFIEYPLMRCVV